MYRVIAYHGKGKNQEVEHDLRLLWESLCDFARSRDLRHIYCFQTVHDNNSPSPHGGEGRRAPYPSEASGMGGEWEVNLWLVLQYDDNVAAKLALPHEAERALQLRNHVDYWFYARERSQKRRTS